MVVVGLLPLSTRDVRSRFACELSAVRVMTVGRASEYCRWTAGRAVKTWAMELYVSVPLYCTGNVDVQAAQGTDVGRERCVFKKSQRTLHTLLY